MNRPSKQNRLAGIIVPMVTPLLSRDELDVAGLERLIEHILAGGVDGLFVLGTTGEGPSLSYRLRRELVDRAVNQVAGRVPVLVGVTDNAAEETLNMARIAHRAGASAVVLAPPCYFTPSQPELLSYFRDIARRCELPLFLYNIPVQTKVVIEPETVLGALEESNIVGVKDSSGDMTYFHRLHHALEDRPEISLLIGPEELLAEALTLGAHGGVPGGGNLDPSLFATMIREANAGDMDELAALHARVMKMSERLYSMKQYSAGFLTGIKGALKCMGLCEATMAPPHRDPEPGDLRTIARHLVSLGLLDEAGEPTGASRRQARGASKRHRRFIKDQQHS